ncbi:MAG: ATP-binding protein [Desulfovibrio sp.]
MTESSSNSITLAEIPCTESNIATLVLHPDTAKIIDVNTIAATLFNESPKDLIGKDFTNFVGGSSKGIAGKMSAALNNESYRYRDRCFPCKSEKFLEITLSPVQRNSSVFILVSIIDITKNVLEEKKLRRKGLQFKLLVDSMTEGLIIFNDEGLITYTNKSFCELLGISSNELLETSVFNYIANEDKSKIILHPGKDDTVNESSELAWTSLNSTKVHTIASPTLFVEGNNLYTMVIVTNVTQHKFNETKNFQTQKLEAVGQLAAGIAHEINTPAQFTGDNIHFLKESSEDLFNLLATIDAILEDEKTLSKEAYEEAKRIADLDYLVEEVPSAINQSLEGISRISKIVLAMKQFSHPESESKSLADINSMLEATITVCRSEWKYHAEIIKDFEKTHQLIPCFQDSVNQVFLNVIINAVHAIQEANADGDANTMGTIHIKTTFDENYATITFCDSGTGVPDNFKSKLFDPFFTTKEVGKGTGQGLALAHSIIKGDHGGLISVENNEDKGATFTIKLPVTPEN